VLLLPAATEGATAIVYAAVDQHSGRRVALKVGNAVQQQTPNE
jgi:hypothetical protein